MVQVENEIGYLGIGGRDRSKEANKLFQGPVPAQHLGPHALTGSARPNVFDTAAVLWLLSLWRKERVGIVTWSALCETVEFTDPPFSRVGGKQEVGRIGKSRLMQNRLSTQ